MRFETLKQTRILFSCFIDKSLLIPDVEYPYGDERREDYDDDDSELKSVEKVVFIFHVVVWFICE
jgi:hypothetical protein